MHLEDVVGAAADDVVRAGDGNTIAPLVATTLPDSPPASRDRVRVASRCSAPPRTARRPDPATWLSSRAERSRRGLRGRRSSSRDPRSPDDLRRGRSTATERAAAQAAGAAEHTEAVERTPTSPAPSRRWQRSAQGQTKRGGDRRVHWDCRWTENREMVAGSDATEDYRGRWAREEERAAAEVEGERREGGVRPQSAHPAPLSDSEALPTPRGRRARPTAPTVTLCFAQL